MRMGTRKLSITMVLVCGLGLEMGVPARGETLTVAAAESLRAPFKKSCGCLSRNTVCQWRFGMAHRIRFGGRSNKDPNRCVSFRIVARSGDAPSEGADAAGRASSVCADFHGCGLSSASAATSVSFGDESFPRNWRVALVDPKASSVGSDFREGAQTDGSLGTSSCAPGSCTAYRGSCPSGQYGRPDLGVVYRADAINSAKSASSMKRRPDVPFPSYSDKRWSQPAGRTRSRPLNSS